MNFTIPNINIENGQFDGSIRVAETTLNVEVDVHLAVDIQYDFCSGDRFTPPSSWVSYFNIEISNIVIFDENCFEMKIDLDDELCNALKDKIKNEYI